MGPSVKFVSAIKDAFFNKKNGGQFFSRENGGGGPGGFGKRPYFSRDFFVTLEDNGQRTECEDRARILETEFAI